MKLKWIVLDWGGVLIENPALTLVQNCAKQLQREVSFVKEYVDANIESFQAGQVTEEEFWLRMDSGIELPNDINEASGSIWYRAAREEFKLHKSVVKAIELWKGRGIHLGFLSNTEKSAGFHFFESGWSNWFEEKVLSYECHLLKPEKEIYQELLDTIKCEPQEVLFLDDKEENVTGAKEFGIHSWQFTSEADFEKLVRQLEENQYEYVDL